MSTEFSLSLSELIKQTHEQNDRDDVSWKREIQLSDDIIALSIKRVVEKIGRSDYLYGIKYVNDADKPNHILVKQIIEKSKLKAAKDFKNTSEYKNALDAVNALYRKVEKDFALICDKKIESIINTAEL